MLNIIWNFTKKYETKLVGYQETKDVFSNRMPCLGINQETKQKRVKACQGNILFSYECIC